MMHHIIKINSGAGKSSAITEIMKVMIQSQQTKTKKA